MAWSCAEVAVDDLGELAFEAAERFGGGLVLGLFALVVGAAGAGVHGLDAGGHVQRVVERAVAGAGEAVAASGRRLRPRSGRCRCSWRSGRRWRSG